jgi:hypothetical protein
MRAVRSHSGLALRFRILRERRASSVSSMSVTVEILDALVDGGGGPSHCALIPAALINGHHFSTSALWKAPNASGVCNSRGGGSTP